MEFVFKNESFFLILAKSKGCNNIQLIDWVGVEEEKKQ